MCVDALHKGENGDNNNNNNNNSSVLTMLDQLTLGFLGSGLPPFVTYDTHLYLFCFIKQFILESV
jgi:hypothetical protein